MATIQNPQADGPAGHVRGERKPAPAGLAPARPKLTDAAKLPRPAEAQSFRVPMATGYWRCEVDPDSGKSPAVYQREKSDDPEAGTVEAFRARLPWVHARIIRRDGSGRRFDTDYLISADRAGPRVIVPAGRVRSGEWAGAAGIPLSDDGKIIAAAGTAIRYMRPLGGEYATEAEAVPRIGPDGRVTVPVAEVLPDGYLTTGPLGQAPALARWRDVIIPVALANPRMALAIGAGVSAPYLGALARQSHVVDLDGDSDQGKTTTLRVCAGVWGNPFIKGGVAGSWNGTKIRVPRLLGLLGILPAFLDERGLAPFAPAEWGQVIYSITEGPRQTAESRGQGIRLTAPWDGVVLSAGNGRMLDGLGAGKYAGVNVKRVVSLSTPFTRSAVEAESVIPALRDAYGHPGMAVLARFTVAEVDQLIRAAIPLVGMPAGGNPRSLAKNLHGHVAGAAMLDQVLGTGTALRDAAAVAAREYLEANGHDPEHDADRMLTLLRDSITAEPASWPTVAEYREHKLPRPGYNSDGQIDPGRIELPQHGVDRSLAGIRADDGSWFAVFGRALDELLTRAGADKSVALAEADRRGWLHRTATDRAGGKLATFIKGIGRMHRFALPDMTDDDGQAPAEPVAPEPEPEPAPEPVAARCPACEYAPPMHAADCPDLPPLPPDPGPELDEHEDQDHEPAGPETAIAALALIRAPEVAEVIEPPFTLAVRAYLADCASVTVPLNPKYHPTAEGARKAIVHRGKAEADAIRAAFALATEYPAAEPVTAPAEVEPGPELDGREDQDHGPAPEPRALTAGDDELAAFTRAVRKLDADATDDDLTAALAIFHTATDGVRWVSYAGQVGQAWFARLAAQYPSMRLPEALASPRVREVAESGPRTRVNYTDKPRGQIRPGKHYVTSYDLNGQHAAAAGSAELGDGEPEVVESPRQITALIRFPGYVRVGHPLRTGHPAFGTIPAGEWVAMPLIGFLIRDLGLTVEAAEVIYWPKRGRRLGTYIARYRDARDKLMKAEQTEPVRLALAALKSQANAFVGMFHSETYSHGGFYRPDWYDMVVATAEANALRALAKCKRAPVAKMADSAYWIADHEPYEPEGLTISGQLGKWKLDRHGPVSTDLIASLKNSPAAVRDAVIQIDAERRATQ